MDKTWNIILVVAVFLVVVFAQTPLMAFSIGEAIEATADRLDARQIKTGVSAGSWPAEASFTGSIVAGMVSAYEQTCKNAYRNSAQLGGNYILWAAQGNFYGDEAFALTGLSQISTNPGSNTWRTAVGDFYYNVKHEVGTEVYISGYVGTEPSTAVFYIANHVVAAHYVNADDKEIWRQGLMDWLAQIDDSTASFPVMGLGVATWALAVTGPLDETPIDPFGTGAPYWSSKKLQDLPGLLCSHQVPDGRPYAGSFYWRFDHTNGGNAANEVAGYTEDTIFGTLGLIACQVNPDLDLEDPILAARHALLIGVYPGGMVYNHLWRQGQIYYTYAGEMLQVLGELIIAGDLDLDGGVDFIDYAIFANNWLASGCTACPWCDGADLDKSGEVNFADLQILVENWLKGL